MKTFERCGQAQPSAEINNESRAYFMSAVSVVYNKQDRAERQPFALLVRFTESPNSLRACTTIPAAIEPKSCAVEL